MSASVETFLPRRLRLPPQPLRYILMAAVLMAATYSALYFPYAEGSFPVRLLTWYLHGIAQVSALGARLFDRTVEAHGDLVSGQFALRIVLDCGALDAHALLLSAVLAFPVPWRRRLVGVVVGSVPLAVVNVGRIVSLYVIGLRWPAAFHVAHEEVFQFGIIAAAFVTFWIWTTWARRPVAGGSIEKPPVATEAPAAP